ncbi:hypothetical protein Rhopal_001874-T1 [Rhodotorula paludigena]|uniref:Uncharacterized protein n=1 Tax=Rhodotorula paludigena TaxID=86838 RepID=A0AAV5GFK7_9BASI|nr:hypothetical protein Rhopal_001874-T1 [Rhodotorula paludigena]
MRLPSPPRTPVSSVASSFLSFSPDAPRTPSCTSPLSPSPLFDDTTPKARRQTLFNAVSCPKIIKLEPPPKRKNRLVGDRDLSFASALSAPDEQKKDDSPTTIVKTSPTSASLKANSTTLSPGSSANQLASSPSAAFSAFEAKLARRAAARTARRAQAEAEEAQLRLGSSTRLKTLEGFDVEELDRFFGVTPRRAKALRGGYEREAVEAGLLGGASPQREEDKWKSASTEFRELLRREHDSDAGDDDALLMTTTGSLR